MDRHFNIAGPNLPGLHYMLPPLRRLPQAPELVEQGSYFVVHAPRQSGKTAVIRALAEQLTASGQYVALYFSCELAAVAVDDYQTAQNIILDTIRIEAEIDLPAELRPPSWRDASIHSALTEWAEACPRKLVLLIDNMNSLHSQINLNGILGDLRAGFSSRPESFPASVILCGLHDIPIFLPLPGAEPDSLAEINKEQMSIRLSDFTVEDIAELYQQHTGDTGQEFTTESVERVFELSQGQPWLVNALASNAVEELAPHGETVTVDHIDQAKDLLVQGESTHMYSLFTEIRIPRVRELLEPLLAGKFSVTDPVVVNYLDERGVIKLTNPISIANPIYHEFITRTYAPNPAWNMSDPDDPQPVEQENSLTT